MSTKDQRIKDFLVQKRAPLDEWNIHEQLCLASAVACSGDQNWMSVSRSLKGIVNAYSARPIDWFHAKGCATQYGKLLESVETPKRKKRTASERDQPIETPSTPVESLVKKLTEERIVELKKLIFEEQQQYAKLKEEVIFLSSPSMDETKIREMWSQMEQERVQEEKDKVKHDQWLKDREEKKLELERQWRTQKTPLKIVKSKSQEEPTEPDTTSQPQTPQTASSSQLAPTLVNLLDKKSSLMQDASTSEKQQLMSILPESTGGKDDLVKDEEAELLADFNELIAEKFDMDEELEVLNSIIMNPGILEEKISDSEHTNKDVDDSSQATSTDDYDKLKIKQLAETIHDFAVNVDGSSSIVPMVIPKIEERIQVVENLAPTSVEMIEAPMESNDSNITKEEPLDEVSEKIVMISDESSNATDKKLEEPDTNDGESSVADEVTKNDKDEHPIESDDGNSLASEVKEVKESSNFQIEDSEDAIFEDAKEKLDESLEVKESSLEKTLPEIQEPRKEEEHSRSAIDSEDEVLQEVKTRRSKKTFDSLKADTPSSSTRSRDHSENDDNRESATPIRTRSRHSSTAVSETKYTFSKEQDHSMWKNRWDDCAKEIQRHKDFSQIIDNKVMQDDLYKRVCLHPMNMKIIAKNIESNVSTLATDIKRDFTMMCTNLIMLNSKGSKFNELIHQFNKDCLEIIDSNMEIDDVYKIYRGQIKKKN